MVQARCSRVQDSENVERAWRDFREGVMSAAVEVCGVKWCSNQKKWTRWWNEEVKAAIREKLVYIRWMQLRSLEAKENYILAKKEAREVVRNANDNEWMELGRNLQQDYQKNQRAFWQRVRLNTRGSQEVGGVYDEGGRIIEDPEALKRWKRHFEGLLGSESEEAQGECANTIECRGETGRSEEQECINVEEVRRQSKS